MKIMRRKALRDTCRLKDEALSDYNDRVVWVLLSKVVKVGECWEWQGKRNCEGGDKSKPTYGVVPYCGKSWMAHRLTYTLFVGPIPSGRDVLHSCDNMACIRPSHTNPGTHQENMAQRNARGRQARGETSGIAKLTEPEVQQIRYALGSQRAIAQAFGMSRRAIRSIRDNRCWQHLPWEKPGKQVVAYQVGKHLAPDIAIAIKNATGSSLEIATALGVRLTTVQAVKAGRAWKKVKPILPSQATFIGKQVRDRDLPIAA